MVHAKMAILDRDWGSRRDEGDGWYSLDTSHGRRGHIIHLKMRSQKWRDGYQDQIGEIAGDVAGTIEILFINSEDGYTIRVYRRVLRVCKMDLRILFRRFVPYVCMSSFLYKLKEYHCLYANVSKNLLAIIVIQRVFSCHQPQPLVQRTCIEPKKRSKCPQGWERWRKLARPNWIQQSWRDSSAATETRRVHRSNTKQRTCWPAPRIYPKKTWIEEAFRVWCSGARVCSLWTGNSSVGWLH